MDKDGAYIPCGKLLCLEKGYLIVCDNTYETGTRYTI
jgi:hypothetical protein